MPRPKTKEDLVELSQLNFNKLNAFIDGLAEEERIAPFPEGTLNRNIRDVLAHLYHWHIMMLGWYETGLEGKKPAIPAEGYTWRTVPDLNRKIREMYKGLDLEKVRDLLDESHNKIQEIIEQHTQAELFEKKRYAWTGSTSLGAYLISATSSHYDWALRLIKKARK